MHIEQAMNRLNRAYFKGIDIDGVASELYSIIADKPIRHTAYYKLNIRYKVLDRAYKLEHMSI